VQLAIVEMKLGFPLDLLLPAVDRSRAANEVRLAVPATRRGRDWDRRVHRLWRMLGLGLLAVDAARDRIEALAEPGPYRPRSDRARRWRLLAEHTRPSGRSILWRHGAPADHDRLPPAGARPRRGAPGGAGRAISRRPWPMPAGFCCATLTADSSTPSAADIG
jgi:hypothetical protein